MASYMVAVHKHSQRAVVIGGVVIKVQAPTMPAEWADYYGAQITEGVAIVYKAVRGDLRSARGFQYALGATAEAADWDDGRVECGGGLHFSPTPLHALSFDSAATRFLACPVALADMRAPHALDQYPEKIKARRICGPIYEVDRYGKPVVEKEERR